MAIIAYLPYMIDQLIKERDVPDINDYLHQYVAGVARHDSDSAGIVGFAINTSGNAYRAATRTVETGVATCSSTGELAIEHTFPSGKTPITRVPFAADRNDWKGVFIPEKTGITDHNGRAVIKDCWPGIEYFIKFYPDYDGTSEAAINEEYLSIISKMGALLKTQWDSKLQQDWISFKEIYDNQSEQDRFFSFLETQAKGFWDTLVGLWDMVSSIATAIVNHWDDILAGAALATGPIGAAIGLTYLHSKYADSIEKFISELIEDLKKLERSKIERIFFLLVDKSLLYVVFSAVIYWICLLPPDLICEFIARGIAEVVVDIVIGVVLTGGVGLAAKISAQAATAAKNASVAKQFTNGAKSLGRLTAYIGEFAGEAGEIIVKSMNRYVDAIKPAVVHNSSNLVPVRAIATKADEGVEVIRAGERASEAASKKATHIESPNKTEITAERTNNKPRQETNEPSKTPHEEPSPNSNVCKVDSCPISMVTGEELLSLTDGNLEGLLPFAWKRLYRSSAAEINSGLGYGWSHCLSHQLIIEGDKVRWINDENLATELPLPSKEIPMGVNNLSEAAIYYGADENELILAQAHGQGFYHFKRTKSGALLEYINDKYDNRIVITRNLTGRIHRIHNNAGRGLLLQYQGDHIAGVDYQYQIAADTEEKSWKTIQTLASYEYNQLNQLIKATNAAGESEHYRYDELNVIQERHLAGGAIFYWKWEGTGKNVRCLHHWANFGQMESKYDWDDNGTVTVTRKDGSQLVYTHDEKAQLIKQIDPDGGETSKDYNDQGHLIAERSPSGAETRYQYDYQGNLRTVIATDQEITQYGYDLGLVSSVSKGDATWRYVRNERGDITQQIDPQGLITKYDYTPTGKIKGIHYPDGSTHELTWNRLGQLIDERLPQGETLRYRYDSLGRQIVRQDEFGKITHIEYDAVGRIQKIIRPNGTSNQYQYNAYNKVTQVVDEQNRITRYEYAPHLHMVSRKINPDGTEVHYQYNDNQLNLTDITNEKGEHYHIDYHPNGLVRQETSFDGLITSYQYDLGGHLTAKAEHDSQGKEHTTTYLRSPTGNLLCKTLPDGKKINYAYNGSGKLTEVNDGEWPINYEYDITGNLTAEHQGWATLRYQYNKLGILSQCKLPDGNVIDYKHYAGGQLSQINLNGEKLTKHLYSLGQEIERQQGNLTSTYDYDDQGRLKNHFVEQHNKTLYKREYQYSPAGNLETIEDSHKGNRQYFYDPLDRLVQVRGDIAENLIHDPAGNLLAQTNTAEHISIKGNQLLLQGDKHFSYDDFGNLIEERRGKEQQLKTHYQYNSQHQLQTVTMPDGTVASYQYDAFGRRVKKTVIDKLGNKTKTEFIWQGSKIIVESNKHHYQTYLYEPGTFKPLALLKGKGKQAEIYYYQLDHLGTPQEITNTSGRVCWSARYKAYGNLAVLEIAEVDNPLRFQGQYHDQETGLHYNRYRYYNPSIGRYMTPDPIKLAGGLNSYQYTRNPIVNTDPLGLNNCPLNNIIKESDIPPGMSRAQFEEKIIHFRENIGTGREYAAWKRQLMAEEGLSEAQVREIFYRGSLEKDRNIFGSVGDEDWGRYLEEISGTTNQGGMHAHHLVEKKGGGIPGNANREMLSEVEMSVVLERENLGWAPFQTAGVHGKGPQEALRLRLESVRGNREATVTVLQEWLQELQALKKP